MLNKILLAASICLAVSPVSGQVKIIDSKPMSGGRDSSNQLDATSSGVPSLRPSMQADMYHQLQLLQEEVQQLRGLVEEQAHELKRLKQQRLDDYLDLDRRIGQQSKLSHINAAPSASAAKDQPSFGETSADSASFQEGEFASYQSAIGLALKQRDFSGAISALQAHLEQYPSGSYAPNSQYWLGQIYLQKGELELSKKWFNLMIEQYPSHQKSNEAKFKLGKVLHKLSETQRAKMLLQEVVDSGSSASGLARDYLKQNF